MSSPCSTEPPRKRGRRFSDSPIRHPETNSIRLPRQPSALPFNFIRDDLVDDSSDDPDFQADPGSSDDVDFGGGSDDEDRIAQGENGNNNDGDDDGGHSSDDDGDGDSGDGIDDNINDDGSNLHNGINIAQTTVECTTVPVPLHPNQHNQNRNQLPPDNDIYPQGSFIMCPNLSTNMVPEHLSLDHGSGNQTLRGALNHQNPVFDVDDLDSALDEDEQDDPLYHYSEDSCSSLDTTSSDEPPQNALQSQTYLENSAHTQTGSQHDATRNEHPQNIAFDSSPVLDIANSAQTLRSIDALPASSEPLHTIASIPMVAGNSAVKPNGQNDGDEDEDDPDDPDYQVHPTEDDVEDPEDADLDPRAEVNNAHYIEFLTNLLTTGMTPASSSTPISTILPAFTTNYGAHRTLSSDERPFHDGLSSLPTSVVPLAPFRSGPVATQPPITSQHFSRLRNNLAVNNGSFATAMEEAEGQDDDDDFDYLRESARIRDDPLEYRDDFTVPVEEVMQLLSQPDAQTTLRPATRASSNLSRQQSGWPPLNLMPRASTVAQVSSVAHASSAVPAATISESLTLPTPIVMPSPAAPFSQPFFASNGIGANDSLKPNEPACQQQSSLQSHLSTMPVDLASEAAYVSLGPNRLAQFKQQLAAYVQIASHVHIQLARKYRAVREPSHDVTERVGVETRSAQSGQRAPEVENETSNSIVLAYNRSEGMLKRFVKHGKICRDYHAMIRDQMRSLQPMADQLLGVGTGQRYSFDSWRRGVLDVKMISAMDAFVKAVSSKSWDGRDKPLRFLQAFWRPDVTNALLNTLREGRRLTNSGTDKAYPWTSADDFLLALTIAKYGREFGELQKDLLPHREEEDCQRRVRYLSSRRCKDNVVKRQVLHLSSPLLPEEMKLVEMGVRKFGDEDDCETWKRIQRELLPCREWSHLQKIWNFRKCRRMYKATYRAKVAAKKRLDLAASEKDQ